MDSKGTLDILSQLRALATQPASTETGEGKDIGPTGLVRGVVQITVAGGTTLTVYLEGSDDDSTYYRIPGTDFRDPDDGEVMDETGIYEVFFKTAYRYVRAISVAAGGAFTHGIFVNKI
jgi:hypothetical protein